MAINVLKIIEIIADGKKTIFLYFKFNQKRGKPQQSWQEKQLERIQLSQIFANIEMVLSTRDEEIP